MDSFFVRNTKVYEIRERDTNISSTELENVIDVTCIEEIKVYIQHILFLLECGMQVATEYNYKTQSIWIQLKVELLIVSFHVLFGIEDHYEDKY